MILQKTIIGALVGGVVGFVGYFLASKFNVEKKIVNAVTIGVTIAASMIATKIAEPYLQKSKLKKQLSSELVAVEVMPIFKILKESDPEEFEKAIDEISELLLKNKNTSQEQIDLIMYNYGSSIVSKYYRDASSESIQVYAKNFYYSMEEIYSVSPANVCKLIAPDKFGVLNLDDLKNLKSHTKVIESLRPIIESSKKREGVWTKEVASILLNSHREKFMNRNPRMKEVFANISSNSSDKDKEILARGSIDMYKYFLSLKEEESTLIFRAILSGE